MVCMTDSSSHFLFLVASNSSRLCRLSQDFSSLCDVLALCDMSRRAMRSFMPLGGPQHCHETGPAPPQNAHACCSTNTTYHPSIYSKHCPCLSSLKHRFRLEANSPESTRRFSPFVLGLAFSALRPCRAKNHKVLLLPSQFSSISNHTFNSQPVRQRTTAFLRVPT